MFANVATVAKMTFFWFIIQKSGLKPCTIRYYVAVAQRFNRLKTLKSLLQFSLNRDFIMTQKLLKHELVERLLQLKEKQDLLTVQMQLLTQEISELAIPFMPKIPKSQSVITTRLIAQVLRENQGTWLMCGDIAEQALRLVGQPQFVDVGDSYYKVVKRMLLRLVKKGLVERTLSQILCKHPFQLNGDRLGDHQNQS